LRKQFKLSNFFLFFSFLIVAPFNAQEVRKYSNEFLNIGVDAQSLGMSNAVTATTNDVNSCYWNPAGLIQLKSDQVGLMHASYFANIAQYDYAAYSNRIDDLSAWGVSAIRFGVDNILNTTELIDSQGNINYDRVSKFSNADYAFTFSYARKLPVEGLNIGINTKIVRRIIGDFANSWGFGFDLGIQYQYKKWQMGLMVRDFTTTTNVWSINQAEYDKIRNAIPGQNQTEPEKNEITLPKVQLGMARKFEFKNKLALQSAINLNARFERTNDIISSKTMSIDPAIGFDFGYNEIVFLRAGVGNFQKILEIDGTKSTSFQPNLGLGFKYKGVQIDYALTDIGDQSAALYSNIFSLKIDLDIFR
jgi:hypothetical protein